MPVAAEMPRYRCHKVVWALEIKSIKWNSTKPEGGYLVTPADIGYGDVALPAEVFARYTPIAGDFIVQYEDRYWSVSPRKTFIEGYTPISSTDNVYTAPDVIPVRPNASGWVDQRSQPDHAVQELRRWALALANDGRGAAGAITAAAEFEAYVLNGAPVAAKAETDTDDGR